MSKLKARLFADNLGRTEGPLFVHESGEVVVVSIDRGHLYSVTSEQTRLIAICGGGPNGATEGSDGSIYIAQNGGSGRLNTPGVSGGVQVLRPNGVLECLTSDPITPNDLCLGPDGFLYVTDPTRRASRDDGRLWRVDVASGKAELLCSVNWYPNGIGFGREDDVLYVASSDERRIIRYAFDKSGISHPETAIQMEHGRPDGFCFDVDGNMIIGAIGENGNAGDIQTWSTDGSLLDVFAPGPNRAYTNVALNAQRELIITDSDAGAVLIVDDWPNAGLPLHPFR